MFVDNFLRHREGDSPMELKIPFAKMSGAGNDFVVIDNRSGVVTTKNQKELARVLCRRRFGIGADGVLLLNTSEKAEFEMVYINSDGSSGAMCGNGGRCIARFAYSKGIAGRMMTFDAFGYIYHATVDEEVVKLSMKNPDREKTNIRVPLDKIETTAHFLDTGSPHSIVFVEDLKLGHVEEVDVKNLGPSIRNHAVFGSEGTNVDFVEVINDNTIKMRTYERGVEEETLACGTGAVASAIISNHIRKVKQPVNIITRGGETLMVSYEQEGDKIVNVILEGRADIIFRGNVVIELEIMKITSK